MKTQAQWLEKEEKTREGVRTDVSWLETGVQRNKSLQSEKKKKKKVRKRNEIWKLMYKMVGWHHWLNGYDFEQDPGIGGQGSLACCSPWGCRVEHDWVMELKRTWKLKYIPGIKRCSSHCEVGEMKDQDYAVKWYSTERKLKKQFWDKPR